MNLLIQNYYLLTDEIVIYETLIGVLNSRSSCMNLEVNTGFNMALTHQRKLLFTLTQRPVKVFMERMER